MNDTTDLNDCERGAELVAYFYDEATPSARESFDAHLAHCSACRDELAAFDGAREAIGHWRAEILRAAPAALSYRGAVAPQTRSETNALSHETMAAAAITTAPRRSALAALREFFALSPVWFGAGVTTAVVVVCALAALAVVNAEIRWDAGGIAVDTRLRSETKTAPPPPPQVGPLAEGVETQSELDKLVAERDALKRELEETRAQLDDSREANLIAAVETLEPASVKPTDAPPNNSRRASRAAAMPNARRTPQPRRLRDEHDEDDLPRLYDLLTEAN